MSEASLGVRLASHPSARDPEPRRISTARIYAPLLRLMFRLPQAPPPRFSNATLFAHGVRYSAVHYSTSKMKTPTQPRSNGSFSFGRRRLVVTLLVLTTVAFQPATAHARDYYFSSSGNDGNDGSMDHPMLSVGQASVLLNETDSINRVFFKRGEEWYDSRGDQVFVIDHVSGTSLAPTGRREIGAWGPGTTPPLISSLNRVSNSGWTRLGTTYTWYKEVIGYRDAWRLYVNGVPKFDVRLSVKENATVKPDEKSVDQSYEWFIKPSGTSPDRAIVYVNTGSATPPQNVHVHPVGSPSILRIEDADNIWVEGVDFRGGSLRDVVHVEAPCEHVVFYRNVVRQCNESGIYVGNLGDNTAHYVYDIRIVGNLVDKVWTRDENRTVRHLSGDGIYLAHAVDTGRVAGNVVSNFGHVGITLTAYRLGFRGVHRITVEDNDISGGNSGYMHGFDVTGWRGGTTNNIVRRNFVHDYTATCHAQGNTNKFYSNIFARVRTSTLSQHQQPPQPYGLDMESFYNENLGVELVAFDNIVANNTFYDIDGPAITLAEEPGVINQVGANRFYNNLFVNCGQKMANPVAMRINPTVRGTITVQNNGFWKGSTNAPVAQYKGTYYTAEGLASSSALGAVGTNNRQVDPRFIRLEPRIDADFQLSSATPSLISAGGLEIDGGMGSGFSDHFGNQWRDDNGQRPSIGALQYNPQ